VPLRLQGGSLLLQAGSFPPCSIALNALTSEVQGERRAELAQALLSRSLHSPMHLKCIGKGTTFFARFQAFLPLRVSQNRLFKK
jgi:hypothetical protein